jgi:hypothetical protein
VRVANSDELLSDVWGAACEAVYSLIAKRNWNKDDKLSYGSDIEALRQIQEKYFSNYLKMPAVCPGANPRHFAQGGGRFTGRVVGGLNEFVVERQKLQTFGPLTSACAHVSNLAELVEHAFYVHNWTREECAQYVEWHEQKANTLITQNFEHYQDNAVVRRTSQRLTAAAMARQRQRQQRKSIFPLQ